MNQQLAEALTYARDRRDAFLARFQELLRIPTISADPAYRAEVRRAAEWIVAEMRRVGLRGCRLLPAAGHPVVYGEWLEAGPAAPTVLIYAHYDVQPVDPLELWQTPPFAPDIRDGKLFARGAIDDKCGVMVNLHAVSAMLATAGRLPLNVKFFFEGEEESGSPTMAACIEAHRDLLAADLLIICDGGSDEDRPEIFTSLRGLVAAEVMVVGPARDLHSGAYGGLIHNPLHLVGRIVAALHDEDGRVRIPGFYDAVRPRSAAFLAALRAQEEAEGERARRKAGVGVLWGAPGPGVLERKTTQPSGDVNGIYGGYQGEGMKTIIPARAGFKVTLRLVADQDPDVIAARLVAFVRGFATETLKLDVRILSRSWPVEALGEGPAVDAVQQAITATWGRPARLFRGGGTVPVVGAFQRELGLPVTNLGFGTGEGAHAPNEYYVLSYYYRAIETAIHLYHALAEKLAPDGPA